MGAKNLYTIRSDSKVPNRFACVKFDEDLNVEDTYYISVLGAHAVCGCPAGTKTTCRHRDMLKLFHGQNLIDKGWTYNFDKKKWYPPSDLSD